jgi:hypothetical protein
MKVKFKQACELEGRTYGPDMRKKPGIFDVPGYFIFLAFFVALLKDEKLEILDVSDEDFQEENVPEKYRAEEPDALVVTIIENIMMSKEPKEEGEEDETTSDISDSTGASSESSEGSETSEEQSDQNTEGGEKLPEGEKSDEESAEVKEYKALHEKAKRLNKHEKKRYEELKAKLKIKE